jgi:sec-independent protein translocase protein TatB
MLSLSPAKLLVILVIALIVLGPEKLPQVARQIGAAWHDLRGWRSRIESEVRGTFPNLPPTHEVAQAVRSPLAFLDRLADDHERALSEQPSETAVTEGAEPDGDAGVGPGPPLDNGAVPGNGAVASNGAGVDNGSVGANGSGAGVTASPGSGDGAGDRAGTVVPGAFPAVPDDPSMN